jgi:hypothetical protein
LGVWGRGELNLPADQTAHSKALAEQMLNNVPPDKPGSAGEQDFVLVKMIFHFFSEYRQ